MIRTQTSKILRGLAILIVIASHYAEWMYVEPVHPRMAHAISTWGPAGVDIFLLLSGYGLYKSAEGSGIDRRFVLKRLLAVYLPYLIIVFFINCYSGYWKAFDAERLLTYLTASDYWYINVMLVMYIAFMLSFRFGGRGRVVLLAAAVMVYSMYLYRSDHQDFWTLSNAAFVLGVCAAAAEKLLHKRFGVRWCVVLLICGIVGSIVCFYRMQALGGSGHSESYAAELALNVFLCFAYLGAAYLFPRIKPLVLGALGECSLFVYLLHTVAFYAIILKLPGHWPYAQSCMLTAAATLIIAVLFGKLYNRLSKRILKK